MTAQKRKRILTKDELQRPFVDVEGHDRLPVVSEGLEVHSCDEFLDRAYGIEHVLDTQAPLSRRHEWLLSKSDLEAVA